MIRAFKREARIVDSGQTHREALANSWRDRRVATLLTGDFLSLVGDYCASLAFTITALQVMGAGGAGWALAAGGIPRIVLTPFGGVVAERFDVRRLLVVCHLIRALALCIAAFAWLTTSSPILLLCILIFLGTVSAVADPAGRSLLPRLAEPTFLVRVLSARTLMNRVAAVVGAALGGIAVLWGFSAAMAIDAVGFILASAALVWLRVPAAAILKTPGSGVVHEMVAGWRYVATHPLIGPALLLLTGMNFVLSGPVQLGVAELSRLRGWGSVGTGWITACFAIGSGVSALALAVAGQRLNRLGVWALGGALVGAVSLWVLGSSDELRMAMMATALLGVGGNLLGGLLSGIVQTATVPEMTGRVASLLSLATFGIWTLSCAMAGVLLSAVGPTAGLHISAVAAAVLALYGVARPALRQASPPPTTTQEAKS